jgi:hypothetical protein
MLVEKVAIEAMATYASRRTRQMLAIKAIAVSERMPRRLASLGEPLLPPSIYVA